MTVRFVLRHAIALFATVVGGCLLWTVVYFSLIFWTVFFGGGLGSPIAFPVGLLALAIGLTLTSVFLFLPSTAFAEWIARRSGFSFLVQIPLALIALGILCHLSAFALSGAFSTIGVGQLFLAAIIPFGFYWWIAQSGPIVTSIYSRIRSAFER